MRPQWVAGSIGGIARVLAFAAGQRGASVAAWGVADEEPAASPVKVARRAAGSSRRRPLVPAEVVAAMQQGRFADAAQAAVSAKLGEAEKDAERQIAYLALVRVDRPPARGQGRVEARADARSRALKRRAQQSPWAAKIALELAGVLLAAGKVADAEALARSEAEVLLAGDRKDRLAEVYYAFARRLIKPDDPVTPADPKGAYDLLAQARSNWPKANGPPRPTPCYAHGPRKAQAANDHPKAVAQDFGGTYLQGVPQRGGPPRLLLSIWARPSARRGQ